MQGNRRGEPETAAGHGQGPEGPLAGLLGRRYRQPGRRHFRPATRPNLISPLTFRSGESSPIDLLFRFSLESCSCQIVRLFLTTPKFHFFAYMNSSICSYKGGFNNENVVSILGMLRGPNLMKQFTVGTSDVHQRTERGQIGRTLILLRADRLIFINDHPRYGNLCTILHTVRTPHR